MAEAGVRSRCCDCSGIAAYCHAQGYGGLPKDEASALQLARASAAACSRYGQLVMGMLYLSLRVEGLVRSFAAALAHYRLAASQGLDDAQFRLVQLERRVAGPVPLPPLPRASLSSQGTPPRDHSQDCHRCQDACFANRNRPDAVPLHCTASVACPRILPPSSSPIPQDSRLSNAPTVTYFHYLS